MEGGAGKMVKNRGVDPGCGGEKIPKVGQFDYSFNNFQRLFCNFWPLSPMLTKDLPHW